MAAVKKKISTHTESKISGTYISMKLGVEVVAGSQSGTMCVSVQSVSVCVYVKVVLVIEYVQGVWFCLPFSYFQKRIF